MSEKVYQLRKLQSADLFPMFNIVNKIGFNEFKKSFESEEMKKMMKKGKSGDQAALGAKIMFDIAGIVIANLASAETDIYTFLSNISNLSAEEIKTLDMSDFFEMIIEVLKKEEFKDFIKVVSKLFK